MLEYGYKLANKNSSTSNMLSILIKPLFGDFMMYDNVLRLTVVHEIDN